MVCFSATLQKTGNSLVSEAEEKTKDAAIAWIEKLKIKNGRYNPDDNPNPGMMNFFRV